MWHRAMAMAMAEGYCLGLLLLLRAVAVAMADGYGYGLCLLLRVSLRGMAMAIPMA